MYFGLIQAGRNCVAGRGTEIQDLDATERKLDSPAVSP